MSCRWLPWRRFPERGADDGVSLIEVVVALLVLALFASSVVVVLANAFDTSRMNRLRNQASQLAARQIEIVRNTSVLDVPDGRVYGTAAGGFSTTPTTVSVDGAKFTVTQDSEYVVSNSASSTCSAPSGSRLSYRRVSVTVTWSGMGNNVAPRLDTLMQLPVTGLDDTKGVLSVPVTNANGQPVAGATVTVTEGAATISSAVTGDDGCAVIDSLTPASDYRVTATLASYVDTTGVNTPNHTAPAVSAATLTQDSGFVMDVGGAVQVTLAPPAGYTLPATPLDVTLTNTTASPQYIKTFPDCSTGSSGYCSTGSALTRTVGSPNDSSSTQHGLFPFATQDAIYVNNYGDANAPAVSVSVTRGATATTTNPAGGVPLGGVSISNSTSGATLMYAYDSVLAQDKTLQLNSVAQAKGATAKYALPYGHWCLGATQATAQSCASGQAVTLTSAARTASVTVSS
jgi:prepilin-type N-terminal cleavage/methylation domain-containing protein